MSWVVRSWWGRQESQAAWEAAGGKANVPSLFRGCKRCAHLSSPQAHFPASLCLLLLPVLSRSQGRTDELLFRAVSTSARYLACSAQAGLAGAGRGGRPGVPEISLGLDLGLEICLVFFFFFPYYKTKKKIMKYFKHSENNLVHIYSFLRFCGCEQCCLIYFRSLCFFFKKRNHFQI